MSYEDAAEIMCSYFPLRMPIRSLERIVEDLCDGVNRFYQEKGAPTVSPEAVVTVATVDKKGIVIRKAPPEETGPEPTRPNPDKLGKKKMATVISTYVTPRHIRTIDDIIGEVSEQGSSNAKPKPQNKLIWGSLTDGPETTVARLKEVVDQGLPQGNELVCILDGERYLWGLAYTYFPTAFFVLNIFHVPQHLATAALLFHDEDSLQGRQFLTEQLRMLLQGKAGRMI